MRISARSLLSTCVIAALALAVIPAPALAADASPARLTLSVVGTQAQASAAQIRPGVVEVTIGDTFTIPGDEPAPDQLAIVSTADLPYVLSQFGAIFGDPTAPGAGAAAAQGMRNVRAATTWYGGGFKGTTYQVVLPAGTYYVLGIQSTVMGLAQPGTFTVAGEPRRGSLHETSAKIAAVSTPDGGNKWRASGLGGLKDGWLLFENRSKEIHFLAMSGVKPRTNNAQVQQALTSPDQPAFFTGTNFIFEVISPNVRVAIKGPFASGRYLVDCFVPSEVDGMPHALMGMWKLVRVG